MAGVQFQEQLAVFNQKINAFFQFLSGKLRSFSTLTLGEQISFGVIGLGILLILFSIVLFII